MSMLRYCQSINYICFMEIWKDIEGYEGLYQISNLGKVKSYDRPKWSGTKFYTLKSRILKFGISKNGYPLVVLYTDKGTTHSLHRLVAQSFVQNPNNFSVVMHKDDNKLNARADNLMWGEQTENLSDVYKRNLRTAVKNYGKNNKLSKRVCQYTMEGDLIKTWDSVSDAERNGFSAGNIKMVIRGERNHHKGFVWKYDQVSS